MNEVEKTVQKNIMSVVNYLPNHVEVWRKTLGAITNPLQSLVNQTEQLIQVEKFQLDYCKRMESSGIPEGSLADIISKSINERLLELKSEINILKQSNNDLKNKISTLEKSTLDLDWTSESVTIKGNAIQPSLENILHGSLLFLYFFLEKGKNVNTAFDNLKEKDKESLKVLEDSFAINLIHNNVTHFIAMTQYLRNELLLI